MSAKDMFEALGYKEEYHIAYIKYYNQREDYYIWFDKDSKTIEARFDIDVKTLKAIAKSEEGIMAFNAEMTLEEFKNGNI